MTRNCDKPKLLRVFTVLLWRHYGGIMNDRQFTLQHFFFHSDEDILHKFKNIESEDAILQLKDRITKEVRGADWLRIFSNIADSVKNLLIVRRII